MKLSLEQTQMLNAILEGGTPLDDLEEFIAFYGYDESNEPDLDYYTETITYEYRYAKLRREN